MNATAPRGHLLVFDGDHTVNRYHHGTTGMPAAEAIGFGLGRYQRSLRPSFAIMVFDPEPGGPNWRRDRWPDYKADRPERTDVLRQLFVDTRKQCRGWRLPYVQIPGVEADDLIASYAEAAVARGLDVTIVSGDKDLLQVVRDEPVAVRMLDEVRRMTWDTAKVRERFGVPPERIPDLLALIGDKVDGYPGVEGIGDKTAVPLLESFGGFEQLMERRNLVTRKSTYAKLRAHADTARICYELATLRRDIELPIPIERLRWSC